MKVQCPIKVGDRVVVLKGLTLSINRKNEIRWVKVAKVTYCGHNSYKITLNIKHYWFYIYYMKTTKTFTLQGYDTPDRCPNINTFYNSNPIHISCIAFDYATLATVLTTFKIGFHKKKLAKFLHTAKQLKQVNNKFFTTTSEIVVGT